MQSELPSALQVDKPSICREFIAEVHMPPVDARTDAIEAFLADEAALIEANARLRAAGACLDDETKLYAGGN
jgi:hypothetical protein